MIAHASSWINANRNRRSKADIERLLLDALGAEHMIWAPGIKGADIISYKKSADAAARSAAAWDDANLYLAWDVKDNTPWRKAKAV